MFKLKCFSILAILSLIFSPVFAAVQLTTTPNYVAKSTPTIGDYGVVLDSNASGAIKKALLSNYPINTATQTALNGKQDRVYGYCTAGYAINIVNNDGTVACTPVSGTVSSDASTVITTDSGGYYGLTAKNAEAFFAYIGQKVSEILAWPQLDLTTKGDFILDTTTILGTTIVSTTITGGSVTIPATAVSANSCTLISVAATGATTSHWPEVKLPARLSNVTGYGVSSAGSLRVDWYLTDGYINFDVCNPTAASITPTAQTWSWRVKK